MTLMVQETGRVSSVPTPSPTPPPTLPPPTPTAYSPYLVSDERKQGLFLSLCGSEAFETARALVAPLAIEAAPWDTHKGKLRTHYTPKLSKIAAHHLFYHGNQAEGESISNYIAALRKTALHLAPPRQARPHATEAAELSTQEIRKASSPHSTKKPIQVHHEEVSSHETSSSDEDNDVHQTKRERRKFKSKPKDQSACAGCGGCHARDKCRFRDAISQRCSKKGHIKKVCWSAPSDTPPSPSRKAKPSLRSTNESCFALTNCHCSSGTPIGQANSLTQRKLHVTVLIEGASCDMEIDTGSAMSIVSWSTLKRLLPRLSKRQLDQHRVHLRDYQGNDIPIVGVGRFWVVFKEFLGLLQLVVVEGPRPTLLGLEWFDALGMEVTGINSISNAETEALINDFAEVFDGTLGQYTGTPISFSLDPQVTPIRLKPRRVPFALKAKMDEQLDKLIAQGVLEPVDHAKWETPIVTPVKPDGSMRICAGYKCTINKALQQHAYPVPVVHHLLDSLGEGKVFAKLDLAQAYQQLPVDATTTEAQTEAHGPGALLSSDSVLVQYSEARPLVLACDASPFGIGTVLSHRFPDGSEAPLAYFSRTLAPAERNYSQLDKEALALVAGVKKFHEYLYSRTFDLVTDHKPLLGLLGRDRPTPPVLSPRMLRWTVFLAVYHYQLVHRPRKALGHADALNPCPLPAFVEDPSPASSLLLIENLPEVPVSAAHVGSTSAQDRTLRRVLNWVWRGCLEGPFAAEFQPFASRQHELSVHHGCLLWEDRVVVPQRLRQRVLEALHIGHPGIVRMKALARCYVWWPNMDEAITTWVATCQPCQESRLAPPAAKGHTWETPKTPWSRVHIDLAGPFHRRTFMVVVEAYSKWLEVALMTSTMTEAVTRLLQGLFAAHGCTGVLVSDNGPQFTSGTFERYLLGLGIRHVLMAPFNPTSNGQVERMVRSAKEALARLNQGDWHERVAEYLLVQHITPHAATGRSPAEMRMGRRLRSPLDRLHPDFAVAEPPGCANATRSFIPGNRVFAWNFVGDIPWVLATVVGVTGPRSYQVALEDGRLWRRHIDQLRRRVGNLDNTTVPPTAASAPEQKRRGSINTTLTIYRLGT
nr:uncharacterized protein K02A2.6-like [Zootoca vivipara]